MARAKKCGGDHQSRTLNVHAWGSSQFTWVCGRSFVDVSVTTPNIRNMYVFPTPHTINKTVEVRLYRSDCDLCL
jgi:hypothetical protein